jgi:hypothetical protein
MSQDNPDLEERRLRLQEAQLALENSFAKKWLPTLATCMAGIIAAMFNYGQHLASLQETERVRMRTEQAAKDAQIESKAKDEREWGFKIVEMYFDKHDFFDLTKNPQQAESNFRVFVTVAPTTLQDIFNVEKSKIPPPSVEVNVPRLDSLAAVAGVQDALTAAAPKNNNLDKEFKPSDFTVYLQYPTGEVDVATTARGELSKLGFNAPGMEQVSNKLSRMEVRYYRPEQKTFASQLATNLGKALGLTADANNAVLLKSAKKLPEGIIEVWLPLSKP